MYTTVEIEATPDPGQSYNKTCGVNTGLGLYQYLVRLLEANEDLVARRWRGESVIVMTDAEIARLVMEEFPQAKPFSKRYRATVNGLRGRYNRGQLIKGLAAPVQQSQRYSATGQILDGRTGRPIDG